MPHLSDYSWYDKTPERMHAFIEEFITKLEENVPIPNGSFTTANLKEVARAIRNREPQYYFGFIGLFHEFLKKIYPGYLKNFYRHSPLKNMDLDDKKKFLRILKLYRMLFGPSP